MQVTQTDVLSLVYDDRVGVRDVQSVFDDRGAKKHVIVPSNEIQHLVFQLFGFHLTVSHADLHVRDEPVENLVDGRKFLHLVMDEEKLAASIQLVVDDASYLVLVEKDDLGLGRDPVRRGSVDDGKIPGSEQRELQGAGDRP